MAFELSLQKMKSDIEKENKIPTEIASAYTSAMHVAQQLELNLKAILTIADFHEWGAEIATDKQLKKYKNSDEFIDKATLDRLIGALKRTGILKNAQKAWTAFEAARVERNELAHKFLAEKNFENLDKQTRLEFFLSLLEMTSVIRRALAFSSKIRGDLEQLGEKRMKEFC
jgi:hypothetical protein